MDILLDALSMSCKENLEQREREQAAITAFNKLCTAVDRDG